MCIRDSVCSRRCTNGSCTRRPSFNVEGRKTAAYCSQHALDSLVDIIHTRCSYDSCTRKPCFNVEGSKKGAYCSQHAQTGMVDVLHKRCSHSSCLQRQASGLVTDGTTTACSRHTSHFLGSPVVNFAATCKVECCKKHLCWGLDRRQAIHCLGHGPLEEGLVRTAGTDSTQGANTRSPSYRPVKAPSFRVKAECLF